MTMLRIARKALLEYVREPLLLGLAFVFPVLLVLLYYVAFGESDTGLARYMKLMVWNADRGTFGDRLIEALASEQFEGSPVLELTLVQDPALAVVPLREHKVAALLQIPPEFSATIEAAARGETVPPTIVSLAGDPYQDNYVFVQTYVDGAVSALVRQATGQPETVHASYEFTTGTGTMSDFDFGVGGILIFGVMFTVITTAHVLVKERVSGTLRRLRVTRMRAVDLLGGVTLAQMALALVLVPFTLGIAVACGFRSNGSLLLAIGVGWLLTLGAVGLGLITACFARSDGEAANLGASLMVPVVLMSGALYPMPAAPLFSLGDRVIELYDFVPAAPAAEALRRILVGGDGLDAVGYELFMIALSSVLLFALGVVLYRRLQLRRS